jgi:hypothetical protein
MDLEFQQGNAAEDGRDFQSWFVGDLKRWSAQNGIAWDPARYDLRNSQDVEIKWGAHPAGQDRPGGWAHPSGKLTISLLVRGRFRIRFRETGHPEQVQECLMRQEGDYVIWRETMEHTWRAEEDSVILTVRW